MCWYVQNLALFINDGVQKLTMNVIYSLVLLLLGLIDISTLVVKGIIGERERANLVVQLGHGVVIGRAGASPPSHATGAIFLYIYIYF